MIELPEATVIARQMRETLVGRRIVEAFANVSPHRFAFYTGDPAAYPELLRGQVLGAARPSGSMILLPVGSDLHLVLGEGGERILLHAPGATLPKKHQLCLVLDDRSHLTVSVQGWGFVGLMDPDRLAAHPYAGRQQLSPLDAAFTLERLHGLFDALPQGDPRSVKYLIVSEPGVAGIGNGCLQDILFAARLHPRRRAAELDRGEQTALYGAIRDTLQEMLDKGGRDSELDLFGHPGGYRRLMDSATAGMPCPACGSTIEKQTFLGGSVYFCPACQPLPSAHRQTATPAS